VVNGIGIKIAKTEIDQTAGDSILEQLPRVTFCEAKRIPQDFCPLDALEGARCK
jgi:hypothetical protein